MLSFFDFRPRWQTSQFADLPHIPAEADPAVRDDYLIAGGLALVLSRCPPQSTGRRFKAAMELYKRIRRNGRGRVTRELISDASHEVAEFTDQATRDALRRRMRHAEGCTI